MDLADAGKGAGRGHGDREVGTGRRLWRGQRKSLLRAVLCFIAGMSFMAPPSRAEQIRVAYSSISGAMAPLWVAHGERLFQRHGLEVELLYIGGGAKGAEGARPGDFVDNSLVAELEKEGWFKR